MSLTTGDIYVAGVGNTESAVITYQVLDSTRTPIDQTGRVKGDFSLVFQPNSYTGGGTPPTVIPSSDSTDNSGILRTAISSGTQAGVVTIVTSVTLPSGLVIRSSPVKLTVHAGFADQAHFSLIPSRYVFPVGQNPGFTVAVGDMFSNPVQSGTAIYFNSQAGIMGTGNNGTGGTYTDANGFGSATLYTVNPTPFGSTAYRLNPGPADPYFAQVGGRLGYAWVWATTQGNGGVRVGDSVLVVWNSGGINVTGIPGAVVPIPQGGTSGPISITVTDGNGNPLCDGTTITTSLSYVIPVGGNIKFGTFGDLTDAQQFVMPDAGYCRFLGAGITSFTFFVSDLSEAGTPTAGETVLVTLTITSPNFAVRTVSFNCLVQ